MPRGVPDAANLLWQEGQSIVLDLERLSPTTARLTWTLPSFGKVYNGILITASTVEINPASYPTDGQRYIGSADLSSPASKIGNAQVVAALYNNRTAKEILLTGLDPDSVYFCSAHIISNVNTYHTVGVRSYPTSMGSDFVFAGDIPKLWEPPTNPTIGYTYFDEDQKLIFMWTGSAWIPTSAHTVLSGDFDPGIENGQLVGDFFYNTRQRQLKVWDGVNWRDSELQNSGAPAYLKQDVGTDLTYSVRASLIDTLRKQLGGGVICVELTEDQFNISIDNALAEYRRRVDHAYERQFFFVQVRPGQQIYYLNDPALGTNKIVDIIAIYRMNSMGLSSAADTSLYAQEMLTQFYAPGMGYDMVSTHLISAMGELYNKIFAGAIPFNWYEARRELRMLRQIQHHEKVLLETAIEKPEQELLQDRWASQWLQGWAESEALFMLAKIRGKYATLPGPNGGITLNAGDLFNEATTLQTELIRQVNDFEVGQNGPDGFGNFSILVG